MSKLPDSVPPSSTSTNCERYFIARTLSTLKVQILGPYSFSELREFYRRCLLEEFDLFRNVCLDRWMPISELFEEGQLSKESSVVPPPVQHEIRLRDEKPSNKFYCRSGCGCISIPFLLLVTFPFTLHVLYPDVAAEVKAVMKAEEFVRKKELLVVLEVDAKMTKVKKVVGGHEVYVTWFYPGIVRGVLDQERIVFVDPNGNCTERPVPKNWRDSTVHSIP